MLKLTDEKKQQVIDAFEAAQGSRSEAAKILNVSYDYFRKLYAAASRDLSIENLDKYIPDGQKLRGVSTLYGKDGGLKLQWVKTNSDLERQMDILVEAAEAMKADIPKEQPLHFCAPTNNDLCSVYVLTDYHVGQMSWRGEAGEDWNTEKSVDFLVKWFAAAIASAPASEVGVLCQLGDFLHYDSLEAVTPTHRHILDTDQRYAMIVGVAIKALRRIIAMMLQKHKRVHIIMAEGNHDLASSVWLRALFADKYENEPRVTVDNTALPYYIFEWGLTMLGFHHGHKRKMADMAKVFAQMYRQVFGRTKYSYVHMGHYHHIASKEDGGFVVEQHPTMAPKDAHSARGAYDSHRGASVITYSKEFGEVSRFVCRPDMVRL